MSKAYKWNFEKEAYDVVELPEGCKVYTELDNTVVCPSCGQKLLFVNSFVSRRYRNAYDLGYAVCYACYSRECKLEEARG